MQLKHDFIMTEKVAPINELYECTRIAVDDYIINYIRDTLKWIPSHWNTIDDNHCDINYHGITIYTVDGIIRLKNILNAWKSIFVQAPDSIDLKGEFTWDSNASIATGRYERIHIKKSDMLDSLNDLIDLCNVAIKNNWYIVHFGI